MRIKSILCLGVLWIAMSSAQALTVDELVAKNVEARGGLDKIHAIKTLKLEGKLLIGGQFELAFAQYRKAPDSMRIEATLQGLTQVQAWDGRDAWQISPFQGRKDPEHMSADDARALADDAAIAGPLVDWQAQGNRIDYLGSEDIDGTNAHKLKVTLKNGDVKYVYLDPDYFLEIRSVADQIVRGTHVESVTDYGDYELVAGVYFPFSLSTETRGSGPFGKQQITVEKAEANVPMEDAMFAFPAPAGAGH
ncbi:MAG TPA: hypothetical protein VFG55_01880 [Rhodanobacteraceae bacterium]|nr:hypothetical protein [Rhodanobacteraceae bacterium]